jgi:hypothetical protein
MTCPQTRAPLDPERRAVAADLRRLGAKKILIRAAEQGYITELACKMPTCFCPEELGGATYFEPVTAELSDWMPTHEHYPIPKQDGGKEAMDNALLAHACATASTTPSVWVVHTQEISNGSERPARRRSS